MSQFIWQVSCVAYVVLLLMTINTGKSYFVSWKSLLVGSHFHKFERSCMKTTIWFRHARQNWGSADICRAFQTGHWLLVSRATCRSPLSTLRGQHLSGLSTQLLLNPELTWQALWKLSEMPESKMSNKGHKTKNSSTLQIYVARNFLEQNQVRITIRERTDIKEAELEMAN